MLTDQHFSRRAFVCLFDLSLISKSSCLTNERLQCRGHTVPRGYEGSLTLNVSVELIIAICVRAGGLMHTLRLSAPAANRH